MKSSCAVILFFVIFYSAYGKPYPSPTGLKEITTTTPKPWLRFLKDKKSTTTTEVPSQNDKPLSKLPSPLLTRAVGAAPGSPTVMSQSAIDNFLNNLVAYFEPSSYPSSQFAPSVPNALAQDRKINPDTMYDEFYLDWMKRAAEPPAPEAPLPVVEAYPALGPVADPSYPSYMYPAMPMSYSPYFPLAGLKMSKIMAQAQMDAALTAMNITTTPKPIKLKLKITLPGGADLSQLSAITNSLPPGSTFALA